MFMSRISEFVFIYPYPLWEPGNTNIEVKSIHRNTEFFFNRWRIFDGNCLTRRWMNEWTFALRKFSWVDFQDMYLFTHMGYGNHGNKKNSVKCRIMEHLSQLNRFTTIQNTQKTSWFSAQTLGPLPWWLTGGRDWAARASIHKRGDQQFIGEENE